MNPMKEVSPPLRRYQYVIGFLVLVVAFVYIVARQEQQANKLERISTANQKVICAQKKNAKQQLRQTRKFIRQHPDGALGFTRAELESNKERQSHFVAAFSDADC